MRVRLYVRTLDNQEVARSKEMEYEYGELYSKLDDAYSNGHIMMPTAAGAEIVPTEGFVVGYKVVP